MRNSLKSKPKSPATTSPREETPPVKAACEPRGTRSPSREEPLSALSMTPSIRPDDLSDLFRHLPQTSPPVATMQGAESVKNDISRLVQSVCHRTLPPLTEEILTSYLRQEDPTSIAHEAGASREEVEKTIDHALRALRGVRMPKSPLYN